MENCESNAIIQYLAWLHGKMLERYDGLIDPDVMRSLQLDVIDLEVELYQEMTLSRFMNRVTNVDRKR